MYTRIMSYLARYILFIMLMLGVSFSVFAQNNTSPVGEVRLVIGAVDLQSTRSGAKNLSVGDEIFEGDQITTPSTGYAVITLVDDTKFTIKPDSIFKVQEVNNQAGGKVLTELLKGGLKSITGQIGERNPSGFKVDTPLGSIGIRGTYFDARLCQDDSCLLLHEALGCPSEPPRESEGLLYVNVSKGIAYLDDCQGDPDIKSGQVGVTDGKATGCKVLNEIPCFLKEFSWQAEQEKDQSLRSLEVPVLQDQGDVNLLCQGDPICIQCQGDPMCIQCQGDPECYQCQGDPICIQCLGDPLCMQCQGDPLCIQCQGDPSCIQCQADQICIQCMGDPLCLRCQGDPICIQGPDEPVNNPVQDPCIANPAAPGCPMEDPCVANPTAPGCPMEDPCMADPTAPGCPMDPCILEPSSMGCPMDPCILDPTSTGCPMDPCMLDPTAPGCPMDPCVLEPSSMGCPMDPCILDPTSTGCPMDPCVVDPNGMACVCMMDSENPICMTPPMCTTDGCFAECGTSPSPGCICSFEPDRPFCAT